MIQAAQGELHSEIGRFTVGFTSLTLLIPIMTAVTAFNYGSALLGAVLGSAVAAFWYRRTPPRRIGAERILTRRRKRFLKKRAKHLPAGPKDADTSENVQQ
jgi:hypothetical protein